MSSMNQFRYQYSRSSDREFTRKVGDAMENLFQRNPAYATFVGVHRYDSELGDYSKQGWEESIRELERAISEFEAIDEKSLSVDNRVDHDVLLGILRDRLVQLKTVRIFERDPGYYLTQPIMACYNLAARDFAPLEDRLRSMIARLKQIPAILHEGRRNLRNPSRMFTDTAIQSSSGAQAFLTGVVPSLAESAPSISQDLLTATQEASVAVRDYTRFLRSIQPYVYGGFAVGQEVFDQILTNRHMVDWDADHLIRVGKETYSQTVEELRATAAQIDPRRSWHQIMADLIAQHPPVERLVDYYRDQIKDLRAFVIKERIADIPQGEKLIVEPTPAIQRVTIPSAAYVGPAPFEEGKTGRFWITLPDPRSTPSQQKTALRGHSTWSIPLTCAHEAYPGHHLQLSWSHGSSSAVRKLAHSTLFIEGWAFYCEQLIEDMGYQTDLRFRLQRLNDQLWRAARVIIDPSIHTGRMSAGQAVEFLTSGVQMERSMAISEVRRYAAEPTQPMSYVMGKQEIVRIRDRYKAETGRHYTLRSFHDVLLRHGSIPPSAISRLIFQS